MIKKLIANNSSTELKELNSHYELLHQLPQGSEINHYYYIIKSPYPVKPF